MNVLSCLLSWWNQVTTKSEIPNTRPSFRKRLTDKKNVSLDQIIVEIDATYAKYLRRYAKKNFPRFESEAEDVYHDMIARIYSHPVFLRCRLGKKRLFRRRLFRLYRFQLLNYLKARGNRTLHWLPKLGEVVESIGIGTRILLDRGDMFRCFREEAWAELEEAAVFPARATETYGLTADVLKLCNRLAAGERPIDLAREKGVAPYVITRQRKDFAAYLNERARELLRLHEYRSAA